MDPALGYADFHNILQNEKWFIRFFPILKRYIGKGVHRIWNLVFLVKKTE
jgi:hypothetical protein